MTGSTEISFVAAAGTEGGGAAIGQVIGMTVVAVVIGALLCCSVICTEHARSPG
jgi:hypothetical protein